MELSKHERAWLTSDGAQMLQGLGVKEGDNVIDYGCGEGRYTVPLSQIVGETGCVCSVERNEEKVAAVKERLSLFSHPDRAKFFKCDNLETLSLLPEQSIDAILAFDVLQYVEDWNRLFHFFQTVLKPTGFVCIYPAEIPHPGGIDLPLMISEMEKNGFRYEESKRYRMMHNVDMVADLIYRFVIAE